MRATAYRVNWIYEKVDKYSRQIGLIYAPNIVFKTKQVLDMPSYLTEGRRTSAHRYLGVCFNEAKTIFINLRGHEKPSTLENTIIHELVHMRFPSLSHGRRYDERIQRIKNGKIYPREERKEES